MGNKESQTNALDVKLDRRGVLKGAAAGGAVLWAVPVVQVLGVGTADAASGVVPTPPPVSTEPPPVPKTQTVSHGLLMLLCRTAKGTVLVGVKVDEDGTVDGIPKNDKGKGTSQTNAEFLKSKGYSGWVKAAEAGHTVTGGRTASGDGLYLTWPPGCTFEGAWAADGSFSTDGAGLGYKEATPVGNTVVFTKPA